MTAIADAELQRLFSQYQKQVYDLGMAMMSQTSGDVTRDMANHWAGEAHDAFCAALNERLEAAERTVHKLENIKRYEVIDANGIYPTEFVHRKAGRFLMWKDVNELLSAYRQSKERRE